MSDDAEFLLLCALISLVGFDVSPDLTDRKSMWAIATVGFGVAAFARALFP